MISNPIHIRWTPRTCNPSARSILLNGTRAQRGEEVETGESMDSVCVCDVCEIPSYTRKTSTHTHSLSLSLSLSLFLFLSLSLSLSHTQTLSHTQADSTQQYSETLLRLPSCFLCFAPPQV